jgi:hypothetical protein
MRALAPVVLAVVALAAPVALADAPPSLGEIAARDKNKKKGKPITEADLYQAGRKGTVSNPGADNTSTAGAATEEKKDGATPAAGGPKPKTEDELRAEGQTAWRGKLEKARADVTRLQNEVNQHQTALGDPSGYQYSSGRAARVARLEAAKTELATAQQQVASLEEEGRRAGYR